GPTPPPDSGRPAPGGGYGASSPVYGTVVVPAYVPPAAGAPSYGTAPGGPVPGYGAGPGYSAAPSYGTAPGYGAPPGMSAPPAPSTPYGVAPAPGYPASGAPYAGAPNPYGAPASSPGAPANPGTGTLVPGPAPALSPGGGLSATGPNGSPIPGNGVGPSAAALSALANSVDQNTLNAIASQLGVSPDQVNNLKSQLANGSLSNDQIQQLTARFGALNISDTQLSSIAHSLGLSDQQVGQIKQALSGMRSASMPNPVPPNPLLPGTPPGGYAPGVAPTFIQLSAVESKFQQIDSPEQVPSTPSTMGLYQYGYNLFTSPVSTFAPIGNIPVGDEYVVGPGDILNVLMWGRVNTTLSLTVDRDGRIQMDQIGPIQVAGLTF